MDTLHRFGRDAAAELLHRPDLVPPPAAGGEPGSTAWLRAAVARFAAGPAHERRRAIAVGLLDGMDLDRLRRRARELATEAAAPDDAARVVAVRVLAEALGSEAVDVAAVRAVAAVYLNGAATPESDAAAASLVAAFGGVADEATAARIGVLVQACEATAALIRNALRRRDTLVETTLKEDPPVVGTVRMASADIVVDGVRLSTGERVRIDLADAARGSLPFGAGPHACPGREQAVAIATGVLEAVRA